MNPRFHKLGLVGITLMIVGALAGFGIGIAHASNVTSSSTKVDAEVDELQKQISEKEDELSALNDKIDTYKSTIRERQLEALSLESQISVIETEAEQVQAEIEATEQEIEVLTLEVEQYELRIDATREDIQKKKDQLQYYIISTYKNDLTSPLEVALTKETFSDFFREVQYVTNLQGQFQATLDEVQALKKILERQQSSLEAKAKEKELAADELNAQHAQLEGEQQYKATLLDETRESEEEFQRLVGNAQNEQESANNAILSLERQVREKLKQKDNSGDKKDEEKIDLSGELSFMWPVPSQQITARFHDPSYPFRRYFEHPAIDIRAGQGTPIKAAETGVVGIAKDAGMGYSYIMLVHGSGFSTVYGHVSAIYVSPGEYVKQGDIIGLSGAMPGTPGAGMFTTGPHLHFEIRLNGLPVNPELYLP